MKALCLLLAAVLFTALPSTSRAATLYVNVNSTNPVAPYSSWATASTDIQDAVNAANPGDVVLVTNGLYAIGGITDPNDYRTNRVTVLIPITVESVNGPGVTTIEGYQVPGTIVGSSAMRGVYLTGSASLIGFTVTGGATFYENPGGMGAGVWCASSNSLVSNCVIVGNSGYYGGGGIVGGSVYNSSIISNSALALDGSGLGGGAYQSQLFNCLVEGNQAFTTGGAYQCTLTSCVVSNNSASSPYQVGYTGQGGGANLSTLYGCVLTGNCASNGGALASCTVSNSILEGNSSLNYGGGAYEGTLYNCLIISNSAVTNGGGAYEATLNNCTVVSNTSSSGVGGTVLCTDKNSIIYFNSSSATPLGNYVGLGPMVLSWSDTYYILPNGSGNISANPQFSTSFHPAAFSPCVGAGNSAYASGVDLSGSPWRNPPSMGCYELAAGGPITVSVATAFTNIAAGFSLELSGQATGNASSVGWNFGDGTTLSNSLAVSHAWGSPGTYTVNLTAYNSDNPGGVTGSIMIQVVAQPVLYVSQSSTNPIPPYYSWSTAATNIQDAVDATSVVGSLVLVSNGVYNAGGHPVAPHTLTNRVAVTNPLVLQSINGAGVTVIEGQQPAGTSNGPGAVRGAWLCDSAVLDGFTVTGGATLTNVSPFENCGGGILCATANAIISNCVIEGNTAYGGGGGVFVGSLYACLLSSNTVPVDAEGGGSLQGILNECLVSNNSAGSYGGGVSEDTLTNCVLAGNSAGSGGGADSSTLVNCLVVGNSATGGGSPYGYGGGAEDCSLFDCTVVSNSAGFSAGGVSESLTRNSVLFYNKTTGFTFFYYSNYDSSGSSSSPNFAFCCTAPSPLYGPGNITNNPLFVNATNGNFRLQSNSPCINAGNNAYVTTATDLAGNPRISGGTVDIGAYEFQNPSSILSYAWLEQYGLPTDGTADYADTDNNGMNNWQKWIAGLNPTNPASILQMMPPTTSGSNVVVTWQSVTNVNYFIQRSTGLTPPSFQTIATNVTGQTGTTSYTDTNAPAPGPWFYQVGVP